MCVILNSLQYLTMDREESDHEEVELLLEGCRSEIERIHVHCKSMRINVDDSKYFHLIFKLLA